MTGRWRREALAVVRSHMFGTKHSPNVTVQRRVKEIHFVGFVGIALIGQCVCAAPRRHARFAATWPHEQQRRRRDKIPAHVYSFAKDLPRRSLADGFPFPPPG